ncbi:MAG TPA: hypothetical protein VK961_18990 [Chthoniobacter sp.]|nr:hypothetical protein [Chthoniobacter sp.]
MNIVRTLILSALGVGAMAFATPSQASDVVVKERTYVSGDRYHHHHHSDWERTHRNRVVVQDNSDVSVALAGHPHHHHHNYHRDWDHR